MPQTLLALLAIVIATQIAFNQQRSILHARLQMIEGEVETVATSAGLNILDEVGSKAFDQATIATEVEDRDDLEPLPFPTGGTFTAAADVDDYHQIQSYTYYSEPDSFAFTIDMTVRYVDEDDISQVATSQTFAKEVIVVLTSARLNNTVTLSRVYTYP